MPFCVLHKGVVRMKVAKPLGELLLRSFQRPRFALSHWSTYVGVKSRCEALEA